MATDSFQYFLFYKPYGVLSQFSEEGGHPTLAAYLPVAKDVYPVGRLDRDSEGLLLLTNDKRVNAALLHPSKQKTKTYWVQVEGAITEEAITQLQRGGIQISHKGKKHVCAGAQVSIIPSPTIEERDPPIRQRAHIPTSWISISIQEGKNRQIRKMTAAVGFPTLRLVRYSIQNANIDLLTVGQYQEINSAMFKKLFKL